MDGEVVSLETELPVGERRELLLHALARVIALRGYETFVLAPILLPSADYFPEPAERTLHGAGVLILRLLRYAELQPQRVRLSGYRRRTRRVGEGLSIHDPRTATAAWYAGERDGALDFGLELRGLRSDDELIAALAHEVTHAYRDRHRLAVRTRDAEEKLTDLTGVYLGFGVFLTNASHRVETGGYGEAGERLLYARNSLGYLSPAEFALLLATQVVARGLDGKARRKIREALAPNHARLFELGANELGADAAALRHQLGIPEPAGWPVAIAKPVGDLDLDELEIVEPPPERAGAGSVAFRVEQGQAVLYALVAAFACLPVGRALDVEGTPWFGLFGVAILLGGFLGATRRNEWCSGCRGRLRPSDATCPKCEARLVGSIKKFDDRIHAEEQFLASESHASQDRPEPAVAAPDRSKYGLEAALYMAWILKSGHTLPQLTSELEVLVRAVHEHKLEAAALNEAWGARPQPFSKEGYEFTRYYLGNHKLRRRDQEILAMGAKVRPDRGTLLRYSAILDRRLEEWRARGERAPTHAL